MPIQEIRPDLREIIFMLVFIGRNSFKAALREFMGDYSISSCADVPSEKCARHDMARLRALKRFV